MRNFLERAIKNGISRGVSDAIGRAVQKAVEPKATEFVNKAAGELDRVSANTQQAAPSSSLEGAMSNLERSLQSYATEVAKNIKTCPGCGESASADETFCPKCGAKLPELTVAEAAVCPACGKQNKIGTKFCSDYGAKLPQAIAEEQAAQAKLDALMEQWDEKLPGFPQWSGGGKDPYIEVDGDIRYFGADFPNHPAARQAVDQYRQLLLDNGFQPAGQYPSHKEPSGGFYYVKPEKKAPASIFDLFR